MIESEILKRIQIELAKDGVRLFRNNVGCLKDERGRYIYYGLCVGSSDLIGWTPVRINNRHVGSTLPVFTAIEVKTPAGRLTHEQQQFLSAVQMQSGIAMVARSVEMAQAGVREARGDKKD